VTTYDTASLPEQVFGRLALAIKCVYWCSMLRAIPQNKLTAFSRFTEAFEDILVTTLKATPRKLKSILQ